MTTRGESERSQRPPQYPSAALANGTHVQVRCRFDGSWVDGFEIVGEQPDAAGTYRVRRRYDDVVLPATFGAADLRAEGVGAARAWVAPGHN